MTTPQDQANLFLHRTLAQAAWSFTATLWLIWLFLWAAESWNAPTMLGVLALASAVLSLNLSARQDKLQRLLNRSEDRS